MWDFFHRQQDHLGIAGIVDDAANITLIVPMPLELYKTLDIARLFKLKEAGLFDASNTHSPYDDFVAESASAAHQLWPLFFGQAANHLNETGKAARCTVGLSALNMCLQHESQVTNPIGVHCAAGASRLKQV